MNLACLIREKWNNQLYTSCSRESVIPLESFGAMVFRTDPLTRERILSEELEKIVKTRRRFKDVNAYECGEGLFFADSSGRLFRDLPIVLYKIPEEVYQREMIKV
jgi:hypothetical protein